MLNDNWLKEAHRRFDDREDVFAFVETPFDIWTNLRGVFADAYSQPYNEADIAQIYGYADWCCSQPRAESADEDLPTVVSVGFYEHIPEVSAAIKDLPRWFKLEDVLAMKDVLSYQVGDDGFEKIVEAYPKSQRHKIQRQR